MSSGRVIYVLILDHEYNDNSDLRVRGITTSYSSAAGLGDQLDPGPPGVLPRSMFSKVSRADNTTRIYKFKDNPSKEYKGRIYELMGNKS